MRHLIKHYGKYIYRHEDYQAICGQDDCAAQILSLFEYWVGCRIEEIKRVKSYNEQAKKNKLPEMKEPEMWLYETIADIKDGLLGSYAETSIKSRLRSLIEKGFIQERQPRDFDRTKEYFLDIEVIQRSLDEWAKAETLEKTEKTKTTHGKDDFDSSKRQKRLIEETISTDDLYINNPSLTVFSNKREESAIANSSLEIPNQSDELARVEKEEDCAAPRQVETVMSSDIPPTKKHLSSAEKCDAAFQPLPGWRNSRKRNDYLRGFVDYLIKVYLPSTSFYQGKDITEAIAKGWIVSREYDEKGVSALELQFAEFQKWHKEQEERKSAPQYEVMPTVPAKVNYGGRFFK